MIKKQYKIPLVRSNCDHTNVTMNCLTGCLRSTRHPRPRCCPGPAGRSARHACSRRRTSTELSYDASSPRGGDSGGPPSASAATPSEPLLLAAAGAGPRKPERLLRGRRRGIFRHSGRSHPAGGAAPAMAAAGPRAGGSGVPGAGSDASGGGSPLSQRRASGW